MDIYTEGEKKPYVPVEIEVIPENVLKSEDGVMNNVCDAGFYNEPLDILKNTVDEHVVDGDLMSVITSSEDPEPPVAVTTTVATIDISDKPVMPKKDWPGNRCYLYGLTTEYYPVVYRYIQKTSLNIGTIKKVMTDIRDDYPNVVSIYIVDNSKDIHEAFNRARTKYRPSEDRAIFKCMLEDKGITLFERTKEA